MFCDCTGHWPQTRVFLVQMLIVSRALVYSNFLFRELERKLAKEMSRQVVKVRTKRRS